MKITYEQIKAMNPCYAPEEVGITEGFEMEIPEFIREFRGKVKSKEDILWVLLRNGYLTNKDLRLFAVWCARRVQHLMNEESIRLLDVAERYANGEATDKELTAVWATAWDAVAAARYAARYAAEAAAEAARDAAWHAGGDAEIDAQIDRLVEIFEEREKL